MTQAKIRVLAEFAEIEVDEVPIDPRDLNKIIFVIRGTFINFNPWENNEQAMMLVDKTLERDEFKIFKLRSFRYTSKLAIMWEATFENIRYSLNDIQRTLTSIIHDNLATAICEAVLAVLKETEHE